MSRAILVENRHLHHNYYMAVFESSAAENACSGQFIHLRIDKRNDHILRRPFSIFDTDSKRRLVKIVYKVVGSGSEALSLLLPCAECDILGPLGHGFTPVEERVPVAVAGAYGAAATYMLTKECKNPGVLLLGARSQADLILQNEYAAAGWKVLIATDDGSVGTKGNVLSLFPELLEIVGKKEMFFYGCGPHPMLIALAKRLHSDGFTGELSIDQIMCCGVGACFGCVVKVNDSSRQSGWRYARSCAEGPVFALSDVYTGE